MLKRFWHSFEWLNDVDERVLTAVAVPTACAIVWLMMWWWAAC